MTTPTLINVEPTAASRKVKISRFKKDEGIKTYRTAGMRREDEPWIALVPANDDRGKSVEKIMSESCSLYEESGYSATGTGELDAIRRLYEQLGKTCAL